MPCGLLSKLEQERKALKAGKANEASRMGKLDCSSGTIAISPPGALSRTRAIVDCICTYSTIIEFYR